MARHGEWGTKEFSILSQSKPKELTTDEIREIFMVVIKKWTALPLKYLMTM